MYPIYHLCTAPIRSQWMDSVLCPYGLACLAYDIDSIERVRRCRVGDGGVSVKMTVIPDVTACILVHKVNLSKEPVISIFRVEM
jgi:hypothetical protein